ncbi:integrase family protein [Pseudomonas sp. CF150]|nr:integrase family protein [Pseudomonas sp. CF150]
MRQRESRPIDAIAVEMITELQRFQKLLKRLKVIDDLSDLFSSPSVLGTIFFQGCSLYNYNRHLDFACDYFESDLNEHGERYYVRQHQLRRFFAIMFFYTNSFGELDTLRWMLGHRDVEHVWHYLTESLDAKEIRGAGVRYFAELAKKDRLENYKNLQQLLAERFGTTTFKLVDEQQIEDYLSALVEEGKARIEPHFFNDENGKSLKVLFIIS